MGIVVGGATPSGVHLARQQAMDRPSRHAVLELGAAAPPPAHPALVELQQRTAPPRRPAVLHGLIEEFQQAGLDPCVDPRGAPGPLPPTPFSLPAG